MGLYVLSPRDLNLYHTMREVAECISNYYQTLLELECKQLTQTEEYHKTVQLLKDSIEKEKQLYSDSQLNAKLCRALIALAMQTKVPKNFPNNMESIVTLDDKLLALRRVLTKLQLKLMSDPDEMVQLMPRGIREVMNSIGTENIDEILKTSIPSSLKLHTAIEIDVLTLFLAHLNESINTKAFESFRDRLIRTKYMSAFIEPEVEARLLAANFAVSEEACLSSKMIADYNRVPDEVYNSFRNIYGIGIANAQLEKMLAVGDHDYYDSNKNLEVMVRGSLLRAALFVVSQDTAENIQDSFNAHTSSVEYEAVGYSRKISEAIAKEVFSKLPKDKEKHKVVSFRPNFTF